MYINYIVCLYNFIIYQFIYYFNYLCTFIIIKCSMRQSMVADIYYPGHHHALMPAAAGQPSQLCTTFFLCFSHTAGFRMIKEIAWIAR